MLVSNSTESKGAIDRKQEKNFKKQYNVILNG